MRLKVWPFGWTSVLSPPPMSFCPIPAGHGIHLRRFAFRADTRRWLARWKPSASGRPYQWRHSCMTHRERTSCFTTLLLFLFQTVAIAFSLFFPLPLQFYFVPVSRRWGAGRWSARLDRPSLSVHLGLFPVSPFVVYFCLRFHWFLRPTLVELPAIMELVTGVLCLWGEWWSILLQVTCLDGVSANKCTAEVLLHVFYQ